jgi:hypothetical protein
MPESTSGNKYILTFIDSFSRYLDAIADLTAATAFQCFLQFCGNFGIPSHICTDDGTQFLGIFQELMTLINVQHKQTHPYSHQENSIVERANREINTNLRFLVLEHRLSEQWDSLLHVAKRIINSRIHSSINVSPSDLVFTGRVDLQRGILFPYTTDISQTNHQYLLDLVKLQEVMLQRAFLYQSKVNADRLSKQPLDIPTIFPDNSYVLAMPEIGRANKLSPTWLGPYQIVERYSRPEGDVYRVVHLATNKRYDFRVDRLKLFDFDPNFVDPTAVAILDDNMYIVESILKHRRIGGVNLISNLELHVKWLGYPEPTWNKASDLKDNAIFHEYCRKNRMISLIPAKYKK